MTADLVEGTSDLTTIRRVGDCSTDSRRSSDLSSSCRSNGGSPTTVGERAGSNSAKVEGSLFSRAGELAGSTWGETCRAGEGATGVGEARLERGNGVVVSSSVDEVVSSSFSTA